MKDDDKSKATDRQKEENKSNDSLFKPKTNEELNEENPNRRNRKQATQEQLNNPLHGVKLKQILERLVDHYGWEYLAERVNIRCFKYNPNMKSSLGFLRKMKWARDHVEDVYLEMVEEKSKKVTPKKVASKSEGTITKGPKKIKWTRK